MKKFVARMAVYRLQTVPLTQLSLLYEKNKLASRKNSPSLFFVCANLFFLPIFFCSLDRLRGGGGGGVVAYSRLGAY